MCTMYDEVPRRNADVKSSRQCQVGNDPEMMVPPSTCSTQRAAIRGASACIVPLPRWRAASCLGATSLAALQHMLAECVRCKHLSLLLTCSCSVGGGHQEQHTEH